MNQSLHVLVADDDATLLGSLSQALEGVGAVVEQARNGGELIEALGEHGPFDLIITDVSMPWMTGLQAIQSTRSAGFLTPTVVMTALQDDAIAERVRALGDRIAFLRKPFALEELEAAIARVAPTPVRW